MTIDQNMIVTVVYKLTNHKSGELIEETTVENPMMFLFGAGSIIQEFEDNLHTKKVGDTFSFTITSENTYGERNEDQVVTLPINVFHDETGGINEDVIFVGAFLPMTDETGNHVRGLILEMDDNFVKVDFNNPLAGTDLHFEGTVLGVRVAEPEELDQAH